MIPVHRLDGKEFVVNAHLIATVEESPDTVVTLVNGQKFVVQESAQAIIDLVVAYRRKLGMRFIDDDVDAGVRGEA